MWIFAPLGLLMPSTFPRDKVDPQYMDEAGLYDLQVRARAESHLTNFQRDFLIPLGLSHSEIQATPGMDYNFRLYMSKTDFATALTAMVMDIDFDKFKPTAERLGADGKKRYAEGAEYHSVLNSIWGTVCRLGSPGGWWGAKSSENPGGYLSRGRTLIGGGERSSYTTRDWDTGFGREEDDKRPATNWWDDEEFGVASLKDQIGADLGDYTPDEEERRQDILLTVDGIPPNQWDDFLTHEEFALVKDAHREALNNERKEKRRRIIGRRRKNSDHV